MVEQANVVETNAEASAELKSVVDTLFDALTARAAKGLVAAKDVLETVARWLDARAKLAGELATKLSTPGPASSAKAPSSPTES